MTASAEAPTALRTPNSRARSIVAVESERTLVVRVGRPAEKAWWRNLRGGATLRVPLRGETRIGFARSAVDEGSVMVTIGLKLPQPQSL